MSNCVMPSGASASEPSVSLAKDSISLAMGCAGEVEAAASKNRCPFFGGTEKFEIPLSADMILLWYPPTYRRSAHFRSHRLSTIRMCCPNKRLNYF